MELNEAASGGLLHALPSDVCSVVHAFCSARDLLCGLLPSCRQTSVELRHDESLWAQLLQRRFDVPLTSLTRQVDAEQGGEAEQEEEEEWFVESTADASIATAASAAAAACAASASAAAAAPSVATSAAALPSSPPVCRSLRLYRSFAVTSPRPLRLEVLHCDDAGFDTPAHMFPGLTDAQRRALFHVDNLVKPSGKAFCSLRPRNVHVVLALARTARQAQRDALQAGESESASVLPVPSAAAPASSSSAASTLLPYPSSFLLTDLKVISPASGYTSPLSSGLCFLTDHLPSPAEIAAWDNWSEAQWRARAQRLAIAAEQSDDADVEASMQVAAGEGEPDDVKEEEDAEQQQSINWYADGPVPSVQRQRAASPATLPSSFPLRFRGDAEPNASPSPALSELAPFAFPASAASGRIAQLAPFAAFFRLERNTGSLELSSLPLSMPNVQPLQTPYSYRAHLPRPMHGRFLSLTFLRSSGEKANIDASYVGIKGFRKGMHAVDPVTMAAEAERAAAAVAATAAASEAAFAASNDDGYSGDDATMARDGELSYDPMPTDASSPLSPFSPASPPVRAPASSPQQSAAAAAVHPDAAEDGFDFDAPVSAGISGSGALDLPRLREYLASVSALSNHMAVDVGVLDEQLARVQNVINQQAAAQQQQHALRLRMLLLQTQQLQLQLTSQQLQTQATLQHASRLNATARTFLQQRAEHAAALDAERALHRARLALLTEEKEREEQLLVQLRARVAEAKEREERLQETVNAQRAAALAAQAAIAAQREREQELERERLQRWNEERASFDAGRVAAVPATTFVAPAPASHLATAHAAHQPLDQSVRLTTERMEAAAPAQSLASSLLSRNSPPSAGAALARTPSHPLSSLRRSEDAKEDWSNSTMATPVRPSTTASILASLRDQPLPNTHPMHSVAAGPASTAASPAHSAPAARPAYTGWTPSSARTEPSAAAPSLAASFSPHRAPLSSGNTLSHSSPLRSSLSSVHSHQPSVSADSSRLGRTSFANAAVAAPSATPSSSSPRTALAASSAGPVARPSSSLLHAHERSFSSRTQELLESLRASRLQREAEHALRVAAAQSSNGGMDTASPRPGNSFFSQSP